MNNKVSFMANLFLAVDTEIATFMKRSEVDDIQFYGNEEEKAFTAIIYTKSLKNVEDRVIDYLGYTVTLVFNSNNFLSEDIPSEFCAELH